MDYKENWSLLSKLHQICTEKEEFKNLSIYKALYTPVKNFRVKVNNEVVDRIKEIVRDRCIEDKEKVKNLKMILDLDEDSIEGSSSGKDLLND